MKIDLLWWSIWAFSFAQTLDLHSTWLVLQAGGAESTPSIAMLLENAGFGAFILFKVALLGTLMLARYLKPVMLIICVVMAWGTSTTLGVVIHNYALYARLH